MSNYQRVDIEQPLRPEGYCFVDEDDVEFVVKYCERNTEVPIVSVETDGAWHFEMYHKDIPLMIRALKAAYDNLESV